MHQNDILQVFQNDSHFLQLDHTQTRGRANGKDGGCRTITRKCLAIRTDQFIRKNNLSVYLYLSILIAVINVTFSECKRLACKIKAQRKTCKGHFKVREQSWPCTSQTSRKRCPLVLIESTTTADQSEFSTIISTNQNSISYLTVCYFPPTKKPLK